MQHATHATVATSRAANAAAAALGAAAMIAAIYVLGRASQTFAQHLALVLAALAVATLATWFAPGPHTPARRWAIGGMVATLGAALVLGGALSRSTQVDEQVLTATVTAEQAAAELGAADAVGGDDATPTPARNVLLARGEFESLAHPGAGTASLIRAADGRTVLTLTGFSTDAGPDLDVRLVAGNPASDADVEAGTSVRLGKLKGTSGDQQYVLPAGVDPAEFTHVYVWCRAFSVGFTRATLA